MKKRLGIFFGGDSVEHEISIITASQAMAALSEEKYELVPIYIAKNRQLYYDQRLTDLESYRDLDELVKNTTQVTLVKEGNRVLVLPVKNKLFSKALAEVDIIIPILHGTNGEDGTLQGFIEMLKLPYVGCNVQAAAVGQDKVFMRQILRENGLPLVAWQWFYDSEYDKNSEAVWQRLEKNLKYPMIVKPANLGSSVGIKTAANRKELQEAIDFAREFDRKIVVEELLEDMIEVNCSVLGNHESCLASVVEEVGKSEEILSYSDKYESGGKSKGMASVERIIPARLSKKDTELVQDLAKRVFLALDASGVARIDFLQDSSNKKIYVNEINTIPGSLSFYLWKASDLDFSELMDQLISIALDNFRQKEALTSSYQTNILANIDKNKGVKK